MVDLSFREITERIKKTELPEFDYVAGIAEGGLVPASIIAYKLGVELITVRINFRDPENKPRYEMPKILAAPQEKLTGKNILIVDDVSVTGKTLAVAAELFSDNYIKTFTLKGKADFVLFPEIKDCVNWPWKL